MTSTNIQWEIILDTWCLFHDLNELPPGQRNAAYCNDVRDSFVLRLRLLADCIDNGDPMPDPDGGEERGEEETC